jgi:arylformamidase
LAACEARAAGAQTIDSLRELALAFIARQSAGPAMPSETNRYQIAWLHRVEGSARIELHLGRQQLRKRENHPPMKHRTALLVIVLAFVSAAQAENTKRDIPYAEPANQRQMLDVYAPEGAKNLPVVFWIHGGGWVQGDKNGVQSKPQAFVDKGFVFVATNYRFLPNVDMEAIVRDIAKSIRWVHDHIAEYGGDPNRLLVMGHSAGAQLAALICTDERYLKAEGLSLAILKGCVPVDGDTYDVPLMIATSAARRKTLGQPDPKFGHYEKFGSDPAKHFDFSAVNPLARDKGIPPFLLLHVADHADTTAQAQRLGSVLTSAGVSTKVYGAKDTNHTQINANLGLPDDPTTKVLFEFVAAAIKN